jgi:hypothetical protein
MTFAHKDLSKEDFAKPDGVYSYNISKLSGHLATKDTPADLVRSTIMAVELKTYDGGTEGMDIDTLCNGPATPETPADARLTLAIPTIKPTIDGYDAEWFSGFISASRTQRSSTGATIEMSKDPCVRPTDLGQVTITVSPVGLGKDNLVEIKWSGNRIIDRIRAVAGGKTIKETLYGSGGTTTGTVRMNLGKEYNATIEAIDVYGYKYSEGVIGSGTTDTGTGAGVKKSPPTIEMSNPRDATMSLYEGTNFNLRFQVTISTDVREISVMIDDKIVQSASTGEVFVYPISSAGLSVGKHTVKVSATDGDFQ